MKLLLTAFEGCNNSSKILVKNIAEQVACDNLFFLNDREKSVLQFDKQLAFSPYDYIISFGQKPVIKDKLYIETVGKFQSDQIITNYNYTQLQTFLESRNYMFKLSTNAGTSYCNHIYYHGLSTIAKENLTTTMIFLHIPFCHNISNLSLLSTLLTDYITLSLQSS